MDNSPPTLLPVSESWSVANIALICKLLRLAGVKAASANSEVQVALVMGIKVVPQPARRLAMMRYCHCVPIWPATAAWKARTRVCTNRI